MTTQKQRAKYTKSRIKKFTQENIKPQQSKFNVKTDLALETIKQTSNTNFCDKAECLRLKRSS